MMTVFTDEFKTFLAKVIAYSVITIPIVAIVLLVGYLETR